MSLTISKLITKICSFEDMYKQFYENDFFKDHIRIYSSKNVKDTVIEIDMAKKLIKAY